MEVEHVTHEFKPIYNKESKVLMLGNDAIPKIPGSRILLRASKKPVLEGIVRCMWRGSAGD